MVSRAVVRHLWGSPHVRWYILASDGASVGILILCDLRVLKLVYSCVGIFFLLVTFQNVEGEI